VFLCTACGGLAVLLGALFLTVYFMLRSYTSSLNYFETVPTYVPAAMVRVSSPSLSQYIRLHSVQHSRRKYVDLFYIESS
jgi:hypothetical protein